MPHTNQVLNKAQIGQKIKRIAYEIYENNYEEKALVIAGIEGQGYLFAEMLEEQFRAVSGKAVELLKLRLDKQAPAQSVIELSSPAGSLEGKAIVLADDVLNTGRTLAYSLQPFLHSRIKKLEIAVLVNRSHTTFPVQAKYTGYELATTLSDHIEVVLSENEQAVYLR